MKVKERYENILCHLKALEHYSFYKQMKKNLKQKKKRLQRYLRRNFNLNDNKRTSQPKKKIGDTKQIPNSSGTFCCIVTQYIISVRLQNLSKIQKSPV